MNEEMRSALNRALEHLSSPYVQDNKERLGQMGANDIDQACAEIEQALQNG